MPKTSPVKKAAVAQKPTAQDKEKVALVNEMFQRGVHFGHKKSKWNPKMEAYVYGVRNNIHIIDLNKTYELLKAALRYMEETVANGGKIVFIGTRTHASALTKETAQKVRMPYVERRWVGGTFTNFEVISQRLEQFRQLERDLESGALDKYTKREQLEFKRKLETFEKKWGGLKELVALPAAIFVLDLKEDLLAVKEARLKGIPVIALADTNTDPSLVDYPIPANDDSISSLKFIFEQVAKAVEAGQVRAKSASDDKAKQK